MGLGGPGDTPPHPKHATSIMTTQREYVEGCLQWYKEADLQQGNPEDGEWQQCHYPEPGCLGGTSTVLLLKEHHAVQGLLQSDEFNHPCIYGWEERYLSEEWMPLFTKWRSELSRIAVAVTNAVPLEVRTQRAKNASEVARTKYMELTPQQKSEWGKRASIAGCAARRKSNKPVIITSSNGLTYTFSSLDEACNIHGLSLSCMFAVLRGARPRHKGFTGRYL